MSALATHGGGARRRFSVLRGLAGRGGFASGPIAGGGMLLASCTSIQIGAALAHGTFGEIGPLGAVGWRFTLAAAVALLIVRPRVRQWSAKRWGLAVCFGVAAAANEACLYEALARLPLGMAVTLEFLGPITVALTASRGARQLLCALVALSGVALMSLTKLAASPLGVGFALAAAAGWAAYVLFSERAGRDQRPQDSLAISLVVSALLTVPLTVTHVPALTTQGSALITLLIVAGLGTLVPYGLEMAALRRLPPSTAGILFSIEPAIAALVGFIALEQSLDLVQIFGLVLVVSAGANILREADM